MNVFKEKSKLEIFKETIRDWVTRFKIVDTWNYMIIPHSHNKYYFKMSPQEYEDADNIYKDKGTISYEFYPCGGIGWGLKVRIVKTGEVFDITDVSSW